MIKVTRLNGSELVVNSDLIEFVEAIPDTIISLITGKKIMIKESTDEVIDKVADFKKHSSGVVLPKSVVPAREDNDGR
jgi:flagellar protein FlbD